jgi:hypothetical protein
MATSADGRCTGCKRGDDQSIAQVSAGRGGVEALRRRLHLCGRLRTRSMLTVSVALPGCWHMQAHAGARRQRAATPTLGVRYPCGALGTGGNARAVAGSPVLCSLCAWLLGGLRIRWQATGAMLWLTGVVRSAESQMPTQMIYRLYLPARSDFVSWTARAVVARNESPCPCAGPRCGRSMQQSNRIPYDPPLMQLATIQQWSVNHISHMKYNNSTASESTREQQSVRMGIGRSSHSGNGRNCPFRLMTK